MEAALPLRSRFAQLLHPLFEASLVIKGALAAAEGTAGLGLLLFPNAAILALVDWLTRHEIAQDAQDRMALWVQGMVQDFSIQTQHFYALYLCAHGGLKLAMVLLLARRVRWAYPAALLLLAGFVVYQVVHGLHSHSPALYVLSAFDTVMFLLVWREWRLLPVAPHGVRAQAGDDTRKT